MMFKRLVLAAALLFTAGCAHAQTAVVTNPPTVSGDCPSFTDTYGTVGDSGIYCSGSTLKVSKSGVPGVSFVPGYPGTTDTLMGVISGGKVVVSRQSVFGSGTSTTDFADLDFERTADYTGGTGGYVQGNIRVHDVVHAGTVDYEWGLTSVMDNSGTSADGSQNVAVYAQALKRSTGSTWGGVWEVQDFNANPTTSSVTDEHDLSVTGTDNNAMRVIGDWFCKSKDGNPAICDSGLRIHADTNATIRTGILFTGTQGTGIDLSQVTLSNAGIILGDTHHFCLDSLCQKYLMHNGLLAYDVGGSNVWTVSDTGQISATSLTVTGDVSSTGGNLKVAAGKELQLDGAGNGGTFYYDSGTGTTRLYNAVNGDVWKVDGSGNATIKGGLTASGAISTTGAISTSGGDVTIPAGHKFVGDGAGNTWLTYDSGSGQWRIGNSVNGTVFYVDGGGVGHFTSGLSSAALTTGSISSSSETSSGNVQGSTLTSTGNVNATSGTVTAAHVTSNNEVNGSNFVLPTNGKLCLNGGGCTIYLTFDGTYVRFYNGGTTEGAINMSTGVYGSTAGYNNGLSTGVSCSGAPSASFAVSGGIITHC